MSNRILFAALALAATGSFAQATVRVVDDSGGPGVDFTSIASAVAVSAPGDVVVVRPGYYVGFVVTNGIQVLGTSGVNVTGHVRVEGVPAGPRAVLAKLDVLSLVVVDCDAAVLVEQVVVNTTVPTPDGSAIAVRNSTDVRLRGIQARAWPYSMEAMRVDSARVEITHSHLVGARGEDSDGWSPSTIDGGDGIFVTGASDLSVSLSWITAGGGGHNGGCEWCPGGDGGTGIRLDPGTSLILTSSSIAGGAGGSGSSTAGDGDPRPAVWVHPSARARISDSQLLGGPYLYGPGHVPPIWGQATLPDPADPVLELTGTAAPGNVVTYTVRGAPGGAARLRLGRQAIVQDLAESEEDRLVLPLRTFDLGVLPASGTATFQLNLPTSLPIGFAVIAQASVVRPTGEVALTTSVPITLH